jgi:hypothetical protein
MKTERETTSRVGARLRIPARVVTGLLAVYAPLVAVLLFDHRYVVGKAYLVLGIWAAEAILWHWLDGHVLNRGERRRGRWHAEPF